MVNKSDTFWWSAFFSIVFTVHSIAFFTPKWISTDTCDSCGLFYHCCLSDGRCGLYNINETGTDIVPPPVFNYLLPMEAFAFSVYVLNLCFMIIAWKKESVRTHVFVGILVYIIVAVLALLSLLLLIGVTDPSNFGYSYWTALVSRLPVLLLLKEIYHQRTAGEGAVSAEEVLLVNQPLMTLSKA
ncbi:uncharacterized protein LOC123555344 [Mercenaria mercenaria]|uniref:uncharacterized protein LOC123555344 n=1 Tax=Mercenaria mercenaria TaxID=6596 RepID=UPI001E1DBE12|nr:uncharacterized protein LOC123555344 [Mercenaria mercenaria]